MRPVSRRSLELASRSDRVSTLNAVWAGDSIERAGLFVLLCLFWGFVAYLALQAL